MSRNRSRIMPFIPPTQACGAARRLLGVLLAAAVTVAAVPAAAATACYSPAEFEAEQAIRLHTELMVVGLTCQRLDPAKDAFGNYQKFTTKHRAALMEYEKRLLSHFRRIEKGAGEKRFHTFRTEMANEVAQRAALMLPAAYCAIGQAVVEKAIAMSTDDFRRNVADTSDGGLIFSNPPCDSPQVTTASAKGAKPAKAASKASKADAKPATKPASGKASKPAAKPVKTAAVQ